MKRKERLEMRKMRKKAKMGKRRMAAGLLAGVLWLSAAVPLTAEAAAQGADAGGLSVYVDVQNGLDTNEGTLEAPVQTLKRAQELARDLVQDMDGDVTVCLRGGRYTLEDTLRFGPEDCGRDGFDVVWTSYEGEEAEISGGIQITDWTLHDAEKGIWSAPAQGVWSRDFFVDGKRAVRARAESLKALDVDGTNGAMILDHTGLPESFARPQDLEVTANATWRWYLMHVGSVSEYKGYMVVQCTEESWKWTGKIAVPEPGGYNGILTLENAYELLDQPGEWYLNPDEDRIYYMPEEGQDMGSAEAVLGRLEELFWFEGTPEAVVGNITLKNLAFRYTTWLEGDEPRGLHVDTLAVMAPTGNGGRVHTMNGLGAVSGEYLDHMTVEECHFEHLGGKGLRFISGIKNTRIAENRFEELAGAAIYVGNIAGLDYYASESEEGPIRLTENNEISDNYIKDVCVTYLGMPGLVVGHAARTVIEHNTLINLPYTGIYLGFMAGWEKRILEDESRIECRDNSILCNYVENSMARLHDGGGIYVSTRYENSLIQGNYVVKCGGNGIYLDDGTRGFTATGNVTMDCLRNFCYKGDYNYIYDNYTAAAKKEDLDLRTPIGDKPVYTVENNDLWDEAAVEAIRTAAGAGQPDTPQSDTPQAEGSESSGEAQPEETDEPAAASSEETQSGAPQAEGSESSKEAQAPEADADASPQEEQGGTKVPAALWVLPVLVLAGGAAVWVIAKKQKKEG